MAVSRALTGFLQENLNKVPPPKGYDSLLQKLQKMRPTHTAPAIKQSPENSHKIESAEEE